MKSLPIPGKLPACLLTYPIPFFTHSYPDEGKGANCTQVTRHTSSFSQVFANQTTCKSRHGIQHTRKISTLTNTFVHKRLQFDRRKASSETS